MNTSNMKRVLQKMRVLNKKPRKSKTKSSHRIIALFFTLTFLNTLIPYNQLWANNNGPNAPEAAAFEPVDATDMVNLVTGDMSYVLPLLNIPSPEGGYPLALSYHAGIAMDQEASWVGLGWSLNPGAINRSVNGYPDDYRSSLLSDYFYDEGGEESIYSLSIGYSMGVSVGVGFSWGSNRALGGHISMGVGLPVGKGHLGVNYSGGSGNSSLSVGYSSTSGLSLGASISRSGSITGNYGFSDTNGLGFSVGGSTDNVYKASILNTDKKGNSFSLGFNLSSSGGGININGIGVGINYAANSAVSTAEYIQKTTSYNIPVVIPTPVGIFNFSFGKQKIRYFLGKNKYNNVFGPMYFYENINDSNSFMDISEVDLFNTKEEVLHEIDVTLPTNKMVFPSYDKFNVQAQGLSGSISARYNEIGGLFGISDNETSKMHTIKYVNHEDPLIPEKFRFNQKPIFHFDHEMSTFINVDKGSLVPNHLYIANAYNTNSLYENRKRKASYIEFFTNDEIRNNYNNVKGKGYLNPEGNSFSRNRFPGEGIGAFKITTRDGKTYHYSLPVYNHEIVTRTFGHIHGRSNENQAYIEKRQLEPYATHWLLTAVTGPDYIDNGDGIAGDGDLGYWTSFRYGQWSDAFVWKSPYDREFIEQDGSPNIKTWIKGRKQIYYLNSIKTRTHTALFVKSTRNDAMSIPWSYKSVSHVDNKNQTNKSYKQRFYIPSQKQLKLDRIILLKNSDARYVNEHSSDENLSSLYTTLNYNDSSKGLQATKYNSYENVINPIDISPSIINKAIKVINFEYALPVNSLVKGTPNAETPIGRRLTLDKVYFNGKNNTSLIPPYTFGYKDPHFPYKKEDKGPWGYHKENPAQWSLNEITTPQGAKLNIDYENHKATTAVNHDLVFSNKNAKYFIATAPSFNSINDISNKKVTISGGENVSLPIVVGDKVHIRYGMEEEEKIWINNNQQEWKGASFPCINGKWINAKYEGSGTVTRVLNNNSYEVTFDSNIDLVLVTRDCYDWQISEVENSLSGNYSGDSSLERSYSIQHWEHFFRPISITFNAANEIFDVADFRVKSIKLTDGVSEIKTNYVYGKNGDGVGRLSYLPYASELEDELPHSVELPPAQVMYEYVTVEPNIQEGNSKGKLEYKFEVFPLKSENSPEETCKFGDLYEVKTHTISHTQFNIKDKQEFEIKDKLSQLGRLLQVSIFNSKGHLIKKTINDYYSSDEVIGNTEANIGIEEEVYHSYKKIDYDHSLLLNMHFFSSTKRIRYPNILKSTIEIEGNHNYETSFVNYDLLSGEPLEQITSNSQKDELKKIIIPAYKKYSSMGSKVDNLTNKNMLTQSTANLTQIKIGEEWKTIDANITTWNNNWSYRNQNGTTETPTDNAQKIWRKHKNYVWKGDIDTNGTYIGYTEDVDGFVWGSTQTNPKWINTSTVNLYDHYSMTLETQNIGKNKVATKMTDKNTKVAAVSNAGYNEIFFSDAEYKEDNFIGDQIEGGNYRTLGGHTGKHTLRLNPGDQGFKVQMASENGHRAGQYKISVWIRTPDVVNARIYINGIIKKFNGEQIPAGTWTQLNHYEELSTGHEIVYITSVNGTIYADDFRMHPVAATMTSYVYNEWDELTHILGANNLAIRYEYDDAGRLKRTYSEIVDTPGIVGGFKLQKEIKYNYKAIAKWDQDGNGIIDSWEVYARGRKVRLYTQTISAKAKRRITVRAEYGSGVYEYRWAFGSSKDNLTYGDWTSPHSQNFLLECDEVRYFKCQVRDMITQKIDEEIGRTSRNCETEVNEPDEIIDPVNPE